MYNNRRALLFCLVLALLSGLTAASQVRRAPKVDPKVQVLQYYKQYPDRYIRVTKESWLYDQRLRAALHSFTLNNTAMVPYCEVELRFTYQDDKGGVLATNCSRFRAFCSPTVPWNSSR